jgi:hypothetical protein
VTPELVGRYASTELPVVFIDESFRLDGYDRYYIVAAAMVDADQLVATREALRAFYGTDAMHASEMYKRAEMSTLDAAAHLVDRQTDARDIVVYAPIDLSDDHANVARARCLETVVESLHTEFDASTFVIDARRLADENEADRRTIRDLRRAERIGRDVVALHARPSEEPLLALADILAWSFRQEYARGESRWFEHLRKHTQVTRLP